MQALISIIIPIYNVEPYLRKCVDSIISQTYKNLEIILVDDGSPDNCPKICDEYTKQDGRIRVIHKENEGLSAARNAGLDKATGEFISLVDSDDYIHPSMYEILLSNLMKTSSDISICDFLKVFENQNPGLEEYSKELKLCTNYEALSNIFSDLNVQMTVAWNKLYKKELFDGIRYPVGKIHEDEFTSYKLIHKAGKVVYTDAKLYYYLQRDNSIMGQGFNIKRLQSLDAFKERTDFFKTEKYTDLYIKSSQGYLKAIIENYWLLQEAKTYDDIVSELRQRFRDEYTRLEIAKNVITKCKIKLHLFYINPRLNKFMMGIKQIMTPIKRVYNFIGKLILVNLRDIIYRIRLTIHFKRKTWHIDRKGEKEVIFLMGTPEHGNLGDLAIAEAELRFLKDYFPQKKVIEITSCNFRYDKAGVMKLVHSEDKIFIQGGGSIGTLWPLEETMIREMLSSFPRNKIIIFPQTIFFEESEAGRKEMILSEKVYQSHKDLHICARDQRSYALLREHFRMTDCTLVPDIVLYFNECIPTYERRGILFCMRKDKEKCLSISEINKIEEYFIRTKNMFSYTDTVIPQQVTESKRKEELNNKFEEFKRAQLVITDRLHGMLFAVITGTPCIALNNVSGKVRGVYDWVKHLEYVKFVDNPEDIPNYIDLLMNSPKYSYDSFYFKSYFQKIADLISNAS